MKNLPIKFSILIPAYKSKFLYDAIDSIIKQNYNNWEIIIVDDCSPEKLKIIIDKFDDGRILYYVNDRNYGALNVVDNWNKCLSYATGDYVICMGDDDLLAPNALEDYYSLINQFPLIKVFHGRTELIDDNSNSLGLLEAREKYESPLSLIYYRWKGRYQYIGDFCYEINSLRDNGGFYVLPLAWGSDDITAARQAVSGNGIVNSNNVLFKYRINSLSITNTGSSYKKLEAVSLEDKWFEELLNNYNVIDEKDKVLLLYLKTIKEKVFLKKKLNLMISETSGNLSFIFYWFFNRKKYSLSCKMIIYIFIMSLVEKGKAKVNI